ncbi:MAG TPA: MBL fold metallo-hydrolase [Herpetosiphonaceae bacterium]
MTIRTGAALAAQIEQLAVPQGMVALWALGQSGFVVKSGTTLAVIDPYLSDAIRAMGGPERRFPPPLESDMLRGVDLVLCTHEHPDHTDVETLKPLLAASPAAQVVVSPQSKTLLADAGIAGERIHVPQLGADYTIKDLRYRALPAAHYDLTIDDEGYSRWMGFLLAWGDITLLHTGDTLLVPALYQALDGLSVDVALLPINGRDYLRERQDILGNVLPREATQFAHDIGAEVLIGMHNDLFATNRLNPAELWDDLDRRFPWQRCHLLQPGELYLYVK